MAPPATLEDKMRAAQDGDEHAYKEVLLEVCPKIRGFLFKRLISEEQVEDVLQETLISVHRARHTYDPTRPLVPWVMSIANFRLQDFFRKHYRTTAHEVVDVDDIKEILPENVTESSEMGELALEGLARLSKKEQKIVRMLKLEGFTAKEIALELNMTTSAVKVAAHRAYKKLKTWIEKQHGHG